MTSREDQRERPRVSPYAHAMTAFDDWFAALPEPQATTLAAMRDLLDALLPTAEHAMSYGAPAWTVDGATVAGLSSAKAHWSYLPHSGTVTAALGEELAGYGVSKGAVRVPADRTLPRALVRKLLAARQTEIAQPGATRRPRR